MRYRLLLATALCVFSFTAGAQDKTVPEAPKVQKPSRDFVMLQFTYDNWANKPDSLSISGFGRGFNGYLCYDFPIKTSHFSFAIGAGIGTSSIFFNNQQLVLTDSGQTAARFVPEREDYDKFKLLLAYAEAPLELRYFGNKENRNRGFKMAVGARIGGLIQAHTKGKRTENGAKLTEKILSKDFLETLRLSGTLRIGWGNLSAFGSYNFNSVFKDGVGPQVTPYSIGICLTGL